MLQGYGSVVTEVQIQAELSTYASLWDSEGYPVDQPVFIWQDDNTSEADVF